MADVEVQAPDGTVFVGPTEEAALKAARNYLASKSSKSMFDISPPAGQEGDRLTGLLKSVGGTAGSLVELLGSIPGAEPTMLKAAGQNLRRMSEPTSPTEAESKDIGNLLQFFASPVKAGAAGSLLGAAAKGALKGGAEGAVLGSLQEGELSPEAAAGGAVGGAVGGAGAHTVASAAAWLKKNAPETFAKILSGMSGRQVKKSARAGIAEMLESDSPLVGNLEELKGQAAGRARTLHQPIEDYTAANVADPATRTFDVGRLNKDVLKLIREKAFSPDGQVVTNQQALDAGNSLLRELHEIAQTYKSSKVPLATIEHKLTQLQANYQALADSKTPGAKLTKALGVDPVRRSLDAQVPGRREMMQPFSHAQSLSEGLSDRELAKFYATGSNMGVTGAARTMANLAARAIPAAAGGAYFAGAPGGFAAGAAASLATPELVAIFQSPHFRSMSAATQAKLARRLAQMPTDELRQIATAFGVEAGTDEEEQ